MATKKRETSDRVSSLAARLLAALRRSISPENNGGTVLWVGGEHFTRHQLASVAASCLTQDTTKGKRPAKRKAKRR
jgi:hypothetical protein